MSAPSSAAPGECADGDGDGDGARGFVDLLARERREFNLPSRLRETAERFAGDVLALLFPHFGAGAGTSAGDVAAEHAALRRLLVEALALPGSHAPNARRSPTASWLSCRRSEKRCCWTRTPSARAIPPHTASTR
jgi:hypothetical protein